MRTSWKIFLLSFMMIACEKKNLGQICENFESVNYCYYSLTQSKDLIIFLHGFQMGPDVLSTKHLGDQAYPMFQELVKWDKMPDVLAISYGKSWLLAPERWKMPKAATPDNFIAVMNKLIEKLKLKPTKKILVGISMGSFNATTVYMKFYKNFNQMVLISPMFSRCDNPMTSLDISCLEALLFKNNFNDSKSYAANDPMVLANSVDASYPPIQFQVNNRDKIVSNVPTKDLYQKLTFKGVKTEWVANDEPGSMLQGGHGIFKVEEFKNFISPPTMIDKVFNYLKELNR